MFDLVVNWVDEENNLCNCIIEVADITVDNVVTAIISQLYDDETPHEYISETMRYLDSVLYDSSQCSIALISGGKPEWFRF